MNTVKIAKFLMKRFESFPTSPEVQVTEYQEIFNHSFFLDASELERKELMLHYSQVSYNSEVEYPWDNYFGIDLLPLLKGKVALDLGCLNGGRGIAWFERYNLDHLVGVDIDQLYIDMATQFATMKQAKADFKLANGTSLPFEDETFDAILTFEVFEHVSNLQVVLDECYRVLKTGGRLFLVFPSYFHPTSHHLSLVTNFPGIQYLFSGKTLVEAYYRILEERGREAYWYKRSSPDLESWERGNTINGTTFATFRRLLGNNNWEIVLHSRKSIGSIGRSISKKGTFGLISRFFYPLTFIPLFEDIFTHRITYILEKGGNL